MDDDIDKEMLDEEPVPKKRVIRRAKPDVEGINVPKTTRSNIVVKTSKSDEREDRIMPERATKKRGSLGKALAIFVFILILIAGGYEAYAWYINKHTQQVPAYTDQSTSEASTPPADNSTTSSTPVTASSTPTTVATTTPATIPATQLTINQTPTGYLNVRSTPSSSGKLLVQVHPGETYPYTKTQSGWYQITLTDGSTGWVSGQYVTVAK